MDGIRAVPSDQIPTEQTMALYPGCKLFNEGVARCSRRGTSSDLAVPPCHIF